MVISGKTGYSRLLWHDEFDGDTLDQGVWSRIPGPGRSPWDKYMSLRDDLVQVRDGNLVLIGVANDDLKADERPFLTGGVWTKQKFSFTYGKVEIRARFENQKGAWPAFWMLPEGAKWPDGGEIDIIERLNADAFVYQTCHSAWTYTMKNGKNPPQGGRGDIVQGEYNVYGLERTLDALIWSVNGKETFRYLRTDAHPLQWPYTTPFYLLLDMQLGGDWAGDVDASTLPVRTYIDWVRVWTQEPPTPELPKEGVFFGSASYGDESNPKQLSLCYTGHAHCRWVGPHPAPLDQIRITAEEGLGNCMQFWQSDEKLARYVRAAARRGIYSMNIYSDAAPEQVKSIVSVGKFWLGHDSGECFHWSERDCAGVENPTLKDVADGFMRRVRAYTDKRRAAGWGNILSTGADFSIDYQVAGGINIPCTEDMPFRNMLLSSALERGVARQFGLALWGSHNAHEWNAFIPYSNPLRMPLLFAGFQLKYMTGAKIIINESGNWEVQSVLCQDSPMHDMPHVEVGAPGIHGASAEEIAPYLPAARKRANTIGYNSSVCRGYRREMKRFWNFVRKHPAPKGQPQASFAIAKGNFDLCGENIKPGIPIGGAQRIADQNVNWYPGAPEASWEIVKDAFFPRPADVLAPNRNFYLAGSPYGLCDIASFAYDKITADHLLAHYKALMFAGWNSCSPKQYRILCDYVQGGGRLVIALPHLSCDLTRKYQTFGLEDLVNGGDFSELCGIRVKGRTGRVWWATSAEPVKKPNRLGIVWPRRFGILGIRLGDIEFTDPPENHELLAVDDEAKLPIVIRAKKGRGEVYFINTWCYPSVANADEGAGEYIGSDGLMATVYKYVASISRGDVYPSAVGGDLPDAECDYVICSYFPDDGRVFLKNIDFRKPHTVDVHVFGKSRTITLKPAEMRIFKA